MSDEEKKKKKPESKPEAKPKAATPPPPHPNAPLVGLQVYTAIGNGRVSKVEGTKVTFVTRHGVERTYDIFEERKRI